MTIKEQVDRHNRLSRKHRDKVRELQKICPHPKTKMIGDAKSAYRNYTEICSDCGAIVKITHIKDE